MKEYIKNNKKRIVICSIVVLAICAFYLSIGCPIRFFTGICCPGCGMTRALYYFLKLDFATAFQMHPLIFIMPLVALIYIFRKNFPPKLLKILTILFFVLLGVTYILRLLSGSPVVYIKPESGLIAKIITYITGGF